VLILDYERFVAKRSVGMHGAIHDQTVVVTMFADPTKSYGLSWQISQRGLPGTFSQRGATRFVELAVAPICWLL